MAGDYCLFARGRKWTTNGERDDNIIKQEIIIEIAEIGDKVPFYRRLRYVGFKKQNLLFLSLQHFPQKCISESMLEV